MTNRIPSLMLDAFLCLLAERGGALPARDPGALPASPFLFPDEIAEVLRSFGAGAVVRIYDLFPDCTVYTFSGEYDRDLTLKIYDAIEEGVPVTVNGQDILGTAS